MSQYISANNANTKNSSMVIESGFGNLKTDESGLNIQAKQYEVDNLEDYLRDRHFSQNRH